MRWRTAILDSELPEKCSEDGKRCGQMAACSSLSSVPVL
jgi:hypothetical protein